MIDETEVRGAIQQFVGETFLIDFATDAGPDTDLFAADFIDSFGFVDLVNFIETRFGVKLSDEDLESPQIGCLAGIQALTLDHLGAAGR